MFFNVLVERKDPSILEFSIKQQGSSPERKPIATISKMIRNVKLNMMGTTYDFPAAYCKRIDFNFPYPVEPTDSSIYGINIIRNGEGGGLIGGFYQADAIVKKSLLSKKKINLGVASIYDNQYLVVKVGPGGRTYYYCVLDAQTKKTMFVFEYINSNLDSRLAKILVEDVSLLDDAFLLFALCIVKPIEVDEIARVMDPPRDSYTSIDEEKTFLDMAFVDQYGAE